MRLSIRAKILGGYSFVILLFFAIILNLNITQRGMNDKLKVINEDYLPKLKMVTNLTNYNHLDETFDAEKIIQNTNNSLFMQSVQIYHPKLLENQLVQIKKSLEESNLRIHDPREKRLLALILKSTEEVKAKHKSYLDTIRAVFDSLKTKGPRAARALNGSLERKKRELKSEISFLRKRLDNSIRSGLVKISRIQKKASIITSILSLLAIMAASGITLFALYTLAPIKKLISGVKKISEGDYNFRFHIKSEGEIKTLAQEFNNMSQSILERNNALRDQQKKLLQSERMAVVGRMASHITHEIKNPLNSMSLNTELLEDEIQNLKDGSETREAFALLKSIKKEIERLSDISEEYLSYARFPKGDKQEISLNHILRELTSLHKSELARNKIILEESYSENLGAILADSSQLKQAFMNIIKNAIEALQNGGRIKIETKTGESYARLVIEDDGPGMPSETLEHIFDPFFSTKEKGTGLGLPLTQKIITEQGGEIKCESSPGHGTKFTVLLSFSTSKKVVDAQIA